MGVDSISCFLFDFSDLQPFVQKIQLLSRAKLSFVLMYELTSAYGSFLLSLIKLPSPLIALVANGPVFSMHEKISGQISFYSSHHCHIPLVLLSRSEAERHAIRPSLNVATWRRERSNRTLQQIC